MFRNILLTSKLVFTRTFSKSNFENIETSLDKIKYFYNNNKKKSYYIIISSISSYSYALYINNSAKKEQQKQFERKKYNINYTNDNDNCKCSCNYNDYIYYKNRCKDMFLNLPILLAGPIVFPYLIMFAYINIMEQTYRF